MKFEKDVLYIWVGGSCDYGHAERAGGGAYIAEIFEAPHVFSSSESRKSSPNEKRDSSHEQVGKVIDTYTTADFNTKEFQMIYRAMDHALEKFARQIRTCAEPNATSESSAGSFTKIVFLTNVQYIQNYPKSENIEIKILPYHKFPRQKEVHEMASNAMRKLRSNKIQP